MIGSDEATLDDWAAVLSGTADEATRAKFVRTIEDESSGLSLFLQGLRQNQKSLLGQAMTAASARFAENAQLTVPSSLVTQGWWARFSPHIASLATLAVFWLVWGTLLAIHVHFVFGIAYCCLEALIAFAAISRGRPYQGTLWEAFSGSLYMIVPTLLPSFVLGESVFDALGALSVTCAFVGARTGMVNGFGLRERSRNRGVTSLHLANVFLVYWIVNFVPAIALMGVVVFVTLILGLRNDGQYGEAYLLQWCVLLSLLPAGARVVSNHELICTFRDTIPALAIGGTQAALFLFIVGLLAGVEINIPILMFGSAVCALVEARNVVYIGVLKWRADKYHRTVYSLISAAFLGVAAFAGFCAWHICLLLAKFNPIFVDLEGIVAFSVLLIAGFLLELRLFRFLLPVRYRSVWQSENSVRETFERGLNSLNSFPESVVRSVLDGAQDVSGFYVNFVRCQVSPAAYVSPS